LLTDHVLPGAAFALATIGNIYLLGEIRAGTGPAAGLDATAQAWLFAQRAIYTVFVGLIAVLFIIRRRRMGGQIGLISALFGLMLHPQDTELRREVRTRLVPAIVALLGTNAMALQAFFPVHEAALAFTVPGVALGALGLILAAASLASLGRCFGIFPEVRGLVQHGPYRIVRHPLYLAEIIASVGGILTALSPYSVAVFIVFVALQFKRATYEEQVLTTMFPDYREYAGRTWRLIPGVH
jgi:protein-S-isoprenylcysteine O-methyltransferase Ste14